MVRHPNGFRSRHGCTVASKDRTVCPPSKQRRRLATSPQRAGRRACEYRIGPIRGSPDPRCLSPGTAMAFQGDDCEWREGHYWDPRQEMDRRLRRDECECSDVEFLIPGTRWL